MRTASRKLMYVLLILTIMMVSQQVYAADNTDDQAALLASNSVTPFVAAGELSLLAGGKNGKFEAVQGAKALMATAVVTELLKLAVREKRPNSDSTSSFPSGHTSEAFAMATVLSQYKPKYKLLAFGAATAIAWSRVERGEHHPQDVVAGALLGYFMAKHFTNQHIVATGNGISYQWKW